MERSTSESLHRGMAHKVKSKHSLALARDTQMVGDDLEHRRNTIDWPIQGYDSGRKHQNTVEVGEVPVQMERARRVFDGSASLRQAKCGCSDYSDPVWDTGSAESSVGFHSSCSESLGVAGVRQMGCTVDDAGERKVD